MNRQFVNRKGTFKYMLLILIAICLLFSAFNFSNYTTHADDEKYYSSVVDDLQKDENFNISDYPVIANDYSLQVIQIAESSDKELFVYVYQPSGETKDYRATHIRFSTDVSVEGKWYDYSLTLINSKDTMYKYKVNDFETKSDATRFYNITAIFRDFDRSVDKKSDDDNEVNEVAYNVSQLWTAMTVDGQTFYSYTESETIVITDKYVGYVRYYNGFKLYNSSCDSHYVAFSTDKKIDFLIEADVYYVSRSFITSKIFYGASEHTTYGDSQSAQVTLKYDDEVNNSADGLFGHKYVWNRIESAADFVSSEDLIDDVKTNLQNKQWILRFFESEYKETSTDPLSPLPKDKICEGTEVTDVTILRLKFKTDGVTYNLGVVDNFQTGSGNPSNNWKPGFWDKVASWFEENWQKFLIAIAVVVGFLFLAPFLPWIIKGLGVAIVWLAKGLWFVIKNVAKGLWWLITMPFEIFKKEE